MDEHDFNRHLGIVLRQSRNKAGLTQQGLQDRTNVQRGFISDLECGRKGITVFKLAQLCEGFENTKIADFLDQVMERISKYENLS